MYSILYDIVPIYNLIMIESHDYYLIILTSLDCNLILREKPPIYKPRTRVQCRANSAIGKSYLVVQQ